MKLLDFYPISDYNIIRFRIKRGGQMKEVIPTQLTAFNKIHKEMDIVYHNYAKDFGLSDTAFWILYSVSEHNGSFTQRELCNDWSFTPQTVNSALKELEKRNIITLESVPGNRKNKWIKFTEQGKALAYRSVIPLMQAEYDSFAALNEEERELLLSTTQKHISILRNEINRINKMSSED